MMGTRDNQNFADSGSCYCKNPAVHGGSIKNISALLILAALPFLAAPAHALGDGIEFDKDVKVSGRADVKGDAAVVKVNATTVPKTVDVTIISQQPLMTMAPDSFHWTITTQAPFFTTAPKTVEANFNVNEKAVYLEFKPVFNIPPDAVHIVVDASVFGKNQAAEQAAKTVAKVSSVYEKHAKVIYAIAGGIVLALASVCVIIHRIKENSRKRAELRADQAEKIAAELHSYIFSGGVKK